MTPVVGVVFARGGSKGLARKNAQELGGVPLLGLAVDQAWQARGVERVLVSTDDEELASVARDHGAEVPWLRPAELATDASPEWASWQHAAAWWRDEGLPAETVFLSVPATAPLRAVDDLDACVEVLRSSSADLVLTVTSVRRNPYFTMLRPEPDGTVRLLADGAPVTRRQEAPELYDITPVAYATTLGHVVAATGLFDGRVRPVVVPAERAVDIDDGFDLHLARLLHDHPYEP
ncbi:MAG: acylneuraminate cytidylyltransferase [Actinomycetia bacterium]|nr:acylneuraminate cytidylyltransferase [Actinomycetes bacterium]